MLKLMKAAQEGDINALYASIRLMPNVLEIFDQICDTPLHIAAAAGQTHFAIELMSLKPSFSRKLNPDGFSPLDLALQNKRTETVRQLVKVDHRLIRVQGRGRFTPLHHVAGNGEVDLLAEFLVACPESIQDVNIYGETAVHIAVRKREIGALEVLLGWLKRTGKEEMLNWRDEKGDIVLHVAASTNQYQV